MNEFSLEIDISEKVFLYLAASSNHQSIFQIRWQCLLFFQYFFWYVLSQLLLQIGFARPSIRSSSYLYRVFTGFSSFQRFSFISTLVKWPVTLPSNTMRRMVLTAFPGSPRLFFGQQKQLSSISSRKDIAKGKNVGNYSKYLQALSSSITSIA